MTCCFSNHSWCPHCQDFRPHYNAFAKQMKEIAERHNLKVEVYAISCVPHRSICNDQDIVGYPRVRMFLGEDGKGDNFIPIDHSILHPFKVMQMISEKTGTDASSAALAMAGEMKEEQYNQENAVLAPDNEDSDAFWIHKTKFDTYCDIHLSLHFAMQHGIFVGKDPPNEEEKKTFAGWIEILNHALPPSWPLQGMLTKIYSNITTVLDTEENLLGIVNRYPPPRKTWSRSCSRGDPTMGYTCGLWQLFHTTTSTYIFVAIVNKVAH